ncbi:hypothetical protein N7475_002347 [Penicillium sp. IBT 31633x]|nr:hypothetical protein N7475_002347 [Penicillium sp. IBT 31633x]
MANSSDEEADSRTALVGAPRIRSNPRSTRSASHDSHSRPAKRQRRSRNKKDSDLTSFVPRGGAFTSNPLPVDPDSTSSSGSSSSSSGDSDSDTNSDTAAANPHAGNTAPAISWNQGRKAAVRTTLGKRSAPTNDNSAQFEAVNDKFWRSRSGSASSANGEDKPTANNDSPKEDHSQKEDELEDGEIESKSDTDYSDSLGSEADDSILLNIGDKMGVDGANNYNPAALAHEHGLGKDNSDLTGSGSKEEAFRLFASKYPSAPTALVDLSQQDLDILAKYQKNVHTVVHGTSIKAVPVPTGDGVKDAANEATTNQDAPQSCAISHTRCHVTTANNRTWSLNVITYGNSLSPKHLIGDCPAGSVRVPFTSSSFTLKDIDPNMITNLNTVIPPSNSGPSSQSRFQGRDRSRPSSPGRGRPSGPSRGNGRNNYRTRSLSPDEDDMMSRVSRGRGRPVPQPRGNTRGNIKFASGVGAKNGDSQSRKSPRGRSTFAGNNNRSRSPPPLPRGPPPSRGIGRGRGSQRGGPPRGPRGNGNGRGRGW